MFFEVVKAGFSHPRKQLLNNLSQGLEMDRGRAIDWLKNSGIDPKRRAETLNIADWLELIRTIQNHNRY